MINNPFGAGNKLGSIIIYFLDHLFFILSSTYWSVKHKFRLICNKNLTGLFVTCCVVLMLIGYSLHNWQMIKYYGTK